MRLFTFTAIIVIATLTLTASFGQPMSDTNAVHPEQARIFAVEDEYVAAEVARDETALRRLVDDKFRFNTSRGTTTGKEELIGGVLKMNMVGQTIKERSLVIEEPVALVFGTAELRFANPGKPESVSKLRYTATYVKRAGQWRLLALQMQPRSPQ